MKKQIILILFFLIGKFSFSQLPCTTVTHQQNLNKYWEWREHLKDFVVIDSSNGSSIPVQARDATNLQYNDTPSKIGYYIGMLATEYYLLGFAPSGDTASANQQTRDIRELYYALESVVRIDYEGNAWWRYWYNHTSYGVLPGDLDGFLIRDDVYSTYPDSLVNNDYNENILNKGLAPVPDGYEAKNIRSEFGSAGSTGEFPTYPLSCSGEDGKNGGPNPMSQDELSQLYIGLACVAKFVPHGTATYHGVDLETIATGITTRIMTLLASYGSYLANPVTGKCSTGVNWQTFPPVYDLCKCTMSGSDMGTIGIGIEGIADASYAIQSDFTAHHIAITPKWGFAWRHIYTGAQNEFIIMSFATIADLWDTRSYAIISRLCQKDNDKYKTDRKGLCDIDPVLYAALWNAGVTGFNGDYYNLLLTTAPCHGIQPGGSGGNWEWSGGDRIATGYDSYTFSDVYYGVDYMLFFNLTNIAWATLVDSSGHKYVNYQYMHPKDLRYPYLVKTKNTEYDEKNFWAADSIKAGDTGTIAPSNDYIIENDNDTHQPLFQGRAQVSFRAGHKIDLQPGFEAQAGVLFDAKIDTTIHVMNCTDCGGSIDVEGEFFTPDTAKGMQLNYPGLDTITNNHCFGGSGVDTTLYFYGINGDTAGIKSWNWNFGNGHTSTAYNPTVTYAFNNSHYDTTTHLYDTTYQITLIITMDSLNTVDTLVTYLYLSCGRGSHHSQVRPKNQKNIDSTKISTSTIFNLLNSVTEDRATVQYYLPDQTNVTVTVYSMMGFNVETLINNATENSGDYSLPFSVRNLQAGMYFVTMQAGDFIQTRKLIVVRRQE